MKEEVDGQFVDDETMEEFVDDARKAWYTTISVDAATFILAFGLALASAFTAFRGPVMVVQPAQQVVLYRDGEGENAVLTMAMRLAMINATDASNGDVVMQARITPTGGGPSFGFAATVKPVFTNDKDAASKCDIGARCIALDGLLAIEREDEILDIPGGSVRAAYLAYPIVDWNCEGNKQACAEYVDFNGVVDKLARSASDFSVKVTFYGDGERTMTCKGRAIDAAYLKSRGWMTVSCDKAAVTGEPFF
jgi:hypothetical protein